MSENSTYIYNKIINDMMKMDLGWTLILNIAHIASLKIY